MNRWRWRTLGWIAAGAVINALVNTFTNYDPLTVGFGYGLGIFIGRITQRGELIDEIMKLKNWSYVSYKKGWLAGRHDRES